MDRLGIRHPFFRPLWRRGLTVALCLGWALVELSWGNWGWAVLFGGIGAVAGYEFFIAFDPGNYEETDGDG